MHKSPKFGESWKKKEEEDTRVLLKLLHSRAKKTLFLFPDTLGCFPFDGKDPFVLETLPHVFFVGNQAKFAQKKLKVDDDKEVLLVTLPKFSSSSTVVLLNLQSLQCQPLIFSHFSK